MQLRESGALGGERENMVAQLFYRKQFTSCDKKVFVKNVDDDAMADRDHETNLDR